jgi:hypothetical protein
MRVIKSAMGSVITMNVLLCYQLDLMTPGSSPRNAMLRKQMRQMPNLRRNALGRPQRGQRLYARTLYFGLLAALAMSDFFAKVSSSVLLSASICKKTDLFQRIILEKFLTQ